jgi:hypothetical protein
MAEGFLADYDGILAGAPAIHWNRFNACHFSTGGLDDFHRMHPPVVFQLPSSALSERQNPRMGTPGDRRPKSPILTQGESKSSDPLNIALAIGLEGDRKVVQPSLVLLSVLD